MNRILQERAPKALQLVFKSRFEAVYRAWEPFDEGFLCKDGVLGLPVIAFDMEKTSAHIRKPHTLVVRNMFG